MEQGRLVKATVVDHIVPHRGDVKLFWDENNWQSLCKSCHDHKTMTEDRYQEFHY
jgi:5-methylcytosine-specific restriction protein A